jgi:hypothetical protein
MGHRKITMAACIVLTFCAASARAETIRTCVDVRDGEIRLLFAGGHCRQHERLVEWNLQGPRGPEGPKGQQGPQGLQGLQGLQGPLGPQGAQGAQGNQGPQGLQGVKGDTGAKGDPGSLGSYVGETALLLVDQNNQEVGVPTDPYSGIVLRKVGQDHVVFFASPGGPDEGTIDFFHTTADCSGDRYLGISGGRGFAYYALIHRGAVFFTKTPATDPLGVPAAVDVHSFERVEAGQDAMAPGSCNPYVQDGANVGVVTAVSDSVLASLALPLRIK